MKLEQPVTVIAILVSTIVAIGFVDHTNQLRDMQTELERQAEILDWTYETQTYEMAKEANEMSDEVFYMIVSGLDELCGARSSPYATKKTLPLRFETHDIAQSRASELAKENAPATYYVMKLHGIASSMPHVEYKEVE